MKKNITISYRTFIYFIFITALMQATLRMGPQSFISLYRILLPFVYFIFFLPHIKTYKKEIIFFFIYFIWNLLATLLYIGNTSEFMVFSVHILCDFGIYILLNEIRRNETDFYNKIFNFLNIVILITIVLYFIQLFVSFDWPNVVKGSNSTYFWNENEMGCVLGAMAMLYFYDFKISKSLMQFIKVIVILLILFLADAKLSLIGVIVGIVIYLCLVPILKKKNKKIYLSIFFLVVVITVIFIVFLDFDIKFRDYKISINELLFEPIFRIIMLNPYHSAGSIYDRTDAIIYGLISLKNSGFIGIGLGNSISMLQQNMYSLATAQSMHNFLLQFIVESGILAILIVVFILKKLFNKIVSTSVKEIDIFKFSYAISFILLSSQSSSGIFSNYGFWLITLFVALI